MTFLRDLILRLAVIALLFSTQASQTVTADEAEYYIPVNEWESIESLPKSWGSWQPGWRFCKRLELYDTASVERVDEPIEVDVEFHAHQVQDLEREIRVAEVYSENGPIKELASQVYQVALEDDTRRCRVAFLANCQPQAKKIYLIFYGHSDCRPPVYETDLKVTGEKYALDVENKHYAAVLAKSMGHFKGLSFKQGSFSAMAGGPPMRGGHGVEGTIHWNPDWSDEYTGRYRITNWVKPPHYSVVRGPIVTRVKRWGHPILALGPGVGQPHKVVISVEYTFFASVPYFLMESRLDVLEDVKFSDCRNDEWLGIGMPDIAWMMKNGTVGFSTYAKGQSWQLEDPAWMTYFNKETSEAFASIHVEYECTHPHAQQPAEVVIGGNLWVRYAVVDVTMRKGDTIREKNAYLVHRYEPPADQGFGMLMNYYQRIVQPLSQENRAATKKSLTQANILDALRACYDTEVYVRGPPRRTRRKLSIVDLGFVYGVKISGREVHIQLVMPYKGREAWFDWFADMARSEIKERIHRPVRVTVALVDGSKWSPDRMTVRARRRLGLISKSADGVGGSVRKPQ